MVVLWSKALCGLIKVGRIADCAEENIDDTTVQLEEGFGEKHVVYAETQCIYTRVVIPVQP